MASQEPGSDYVNRRRKELYGTADPSPDDGDAGESESEQSEPASSIKSEDKGEHSGPSSSLALSIVVGIVAFAVIALLIYLSFSNAETPATS